MGIHVILDIDPRGIDKTAWTHAYEDTLALLESWQPPLLGLGTREIDAVRIPVYTRSIRRSEQGRIEAGWSVVGDRESMRTAESQSLYRDLDRYLRYASHDPEEEDIVVAAAAPDRTDTGGPVTVFGNKTQGCPYSLCDARRGDVRRRTLPAPRDGVGRHRSGSGGTGPENG